MPVVAFPTTNLPAPTNQLYAATAFHKLISVRRCFLLTDGRRLRFVSEAQLLAARRTRPAGGWPTSVAPEITLVWPSPLKTYRSGDSHTERT